MNESRPPYPDWSTGQANGTGSTGGLGGALPHPLIQQGPAGLNDARIPQLEQRRCVLLAYLREKLDDNDMHGVQDAASDIREIDAKLSVLRA